MSHPKLTILGFVAILVFLLAGKLGWDSYQQRRAANKLPEVVAILNAISLPSGTTQVNASNVESMPSSNEYAASVWRYYKVGVPFSDLKMGVEKQIREMGFTFSEEGFSYGGPQFYYRSGEFEIRLCEITNPNGPYNVALSANWYGLER